MRSFRAVLLGSFITSSAAGTFAAPPVSSGLVLDLDAASIGQANGTPVTAWNDLAPAGGTDSALSALGQEPTYITSSIGGLPAVRFDGVNDLLVTGTAYEAPYTIFSVSKLNGQVSNSRLISSGSKNWLLGYWGTKKNLMYAEGWVTPGGVGPAADNASHLYSATGTGAASGTTFYAEGLPVAGQDPNGGLQGPGTLSLGGWGINHTELSDGDVSEILIYNRVLNSTELNQVNDYLNTKYALPEPTSLGFFGAAGMIILARRRRAV